MFAWSQLDFSAIPVSISAVSLTRRQTWQNVSSKRRFQRIQNVQQGKRHQNKETSGCFCLSSFCFWGEVSNSWILNDIGRNFLLGNGKKIAKCLMRTFTCRSTFLYGRVWHGAWGQCSHTPGSQGSAWNCTLYSFHHRTPLSVHLGRRSFSFPH